jgi:hypothetical protein
MQLALDESKLRFVYGAPSGRFTIYELL